MNHCSHKLSVLKRTRFVTKAKSINLVPSYLKRFVKLTWQSLMIKETFLNHGFHF